MAHQSELIATDIQAYLQQHEAKELLRFLTCGSVDDGKSTLIGRLLHDSKMIYEDHLTALQADSKKLGTTGEKLDLALLVDGLQAEREQGITIDVAYRYFSTAKRKFIIADTPGHEQYTRNMVTGASSCELAIILIDARQGVLTQTRRHTYLVSLLGIRQVVVAINKMDLVNFSEQRFDEIRQDYLEFSKDLPLGDIQFIPISALDGDNVVNPSQHTPWYSGPALMPYLETVPIHNQTAYQPFRLAVQWVNRPNLNFRGFSGTIASGVIHPGDRIKVLPSGLTSQVKRIVSYDGDLDYAFAGQAVTLVLDDEIDISRGDMLVAPDAPAEQSHGFMAELVWMNDSLMEPGKQYDMKIGSLVTVAVVQAINYRIDINTLEHLPADHLELNEIAHCHLLLNRAVAFDSYTKNRLTGAFILTDRLTNATVAAGMITGSAREIDKGPVTREERQARLGQKGGVIQVPNLAIAQLLERHLFDMGHLAVVMEGLQSTDAKRFAEHSGLLVLAVNSSVVADLILDKMDLEQCLAELSRQGYLN